MNMFEEIEKIKEELPKANNIGKQISKVKLNFYQIFALFTYCIIFFLGIIFGNLFSTCKASSYYFSDTCLVNEFNFSLMVVIWFIGLLVSIVIFSIGHIISLLTEISEKLSKNNL